MKIYSTPLHQLSVVLFAAAISLFLSSHALDAGVDTQFTEDALPSDLKLDIPSEAAAEVVLDTENNELDINTFGNPQQILDKLEQRGTHLGDFDLTVQVSYGGMSPENAEKSMRLFAKEVLPEVQSWARQAA